MQTTPLLMLGLPKGSLEESTIQLFAKAGFKISKSARSYRPSFDDAELDGRFVRAQEVSRYVEYAYFDCGLTGQDWVKENGSDEVEVCDLVYSRFQPAFKMDCRCTRGFVDSNVQDLQGKRIATEVVNITNQYLKDNGVEADGSFPGGATEVKVPDLVDAIVDLTRLEIRCVRTSFGLWTPFCLPTRYWLPKRLGKTRKSARRLRISPCFCNRHWKLRKRTQAEH